MVLAVAALRIGMAVAVTTTLAACSSPREHGFFASRTVFDNPYAAPELDDRMVGPIPEGTLGEDGRWIDGLYYPGVGQEAYDRNGNRVFLTRRERRELRERARQIRRTADLLARVEQFNARNRDSSPPPVPSAPPTATGTGGHADGGRPPDLFPAPARSSAPPIRREPQAPRGIPR